MRRVLVTGANGFIGSHLVEALEASGADVTAVDCRRPRFDDPLVPGVGRQVHLDLLHDDLDDVVAGCEVVFHLAARPGVRGSWGNTFGDYLATNVHATQRLLEVCRRWDVRRLVFASSSSVYGDAIGPSCEDDECRPMSPYGVTKLAAEQLCLSYARREDSPLSVVALRYFTVYGPRQRPDMAFSRMLFAAFTGLPLTLFGDGTQRREFTYVSDVVAATMAAADADARDEVINVGGGASVSMIEAIDLASQVVGRPIPLNAVAGMPGDVPATRADLALARELLGYTPSVDLHEGLSRQAAWMRDLPNERLVAFTR
ncbi:MULTISPECIES: NAD-dependent epimerase/dehydratase family protein [Salinispora]|uniref:NAD-dependent epimerase/dehydratase family protein n=1 Tax=Salinispora TaxID=168694 RepID=UPI00035FAA1B|nr:MULTISPECIES: NAD-dependent epimerase/dehydratase family protein [Salinispora]